MNSTLLRHLMMVVVAGAVLVAVTYQLDEFNNYLLASAAAFLCVTAGLTVLIGLNVTDGLQRVVPGYTTALQNSASLIKDRALPPLIFLLQCTFRQALFALQHLGAGLGADRE